MDIETAALGFNAVGSEPRLAVLICLVRAGPDGLSIGEIQSRVGQPASTLAHHLRTLAAAGLVSQEKKGRAVINRAAYQNLETLAQFLLRECCVEVYDRTIGSTEPGNQYQPRSSKEPAES